MLFITAKQKSEGVKYLVQIVVYDLPDRDCAALASNGEFSIANDGLNKYKNYIDQIAKQVAAYPDVRVVAIVEPDSLANLVTNLNVSKCNGAQTAYKEGVIYAMKTLSNVKVFQYLDAGHAGWLGWQANLQPAANLYKQLYASAGSPEYVRGLASDVSNYNALVYAALHCFSDPKHTLTCPLIVPRPLTQSPLETATTTRSTTWKLWVLS